MKRWHVLLLNVLQHFAAHIEMQSSEFGFAAVANDAVDLAGWINQQRQGAIEISERFDISADTHTRPTFASELTVRDTSPTLLMRPQLRPLLFCFCFRFALLLAPISSLQFVQKY